MEKFTNQESNLEFKSHLEEKLFEFITNSEYRLSGQSAVNIILATKGLKPVSEITITSFDDENLDKQISEIESLLVDSGLFISEHVSEDNPGEISHNFDISIDEKIFNNFKELTNSNIFEYNETKYYRNVGNFFGYPNTAIEAYISGNVIDDQDIPQEVLNSEIGRFYVSASLFVLSKDHWQDELEYLKIWADKLKEESPVIYRTIILDSYLTDLKEMSSYVQNWNIDKRKKFFEKLLQIKTEDLNEDRIKEEILVY